MYAGTKLALQKEADLTQVYEVRQLDELTLIGLSEIVSVTAHCVLSIKSR
jgi:hypothetical protein